MIDIIMGYDCNVQCDYCTISQEMRPHRMSTSQIREALEFGRKEGLHAVSFGGGEPTIRKDLARLVELSRDLGYTTIKIQSNGLMYAYPNFVESLVVSGANQFNISLMGWNRPMYGRIMGQERFFELVSQGVDHLVSKGALVVGDIIMKSDTYRELPSTVAYWAERGVERFVFWLVSRTDRNRDNEDSLVSVSTLRPYLFEAFEVGRRLGISVHSRHIPRCMLPGYFEHVWDVREDRVFVVTPESSFWLADSRITANSFVERCDGCRARPTCMGIRRDYIEFLGDSEVSPLLETP